MLSVPTELAVTLMVPVLVSMPLLTARVEVQPGLSITCKVMVPALLKPLAAVSAA